jgi:hypothetical protein
MRDGTVSGGAQGRELRARRGDLLMAPHGGARPVPRAKKHAPAAAPVAQLLLAAALASGPGGCTGPSVPTVEWRTGSAGRSCTHTCPSRRCADVTVRTKSQLEDIVPLLSPRVTCAKYGSDAKPDFGIVDPAYDVTEKGCYYSSTLGSEIAEHCDASDKDSRRFCPCAPAVAVHCAASAPAPHAAPCKEGVYGDHGCIAACETGYRAKSGSDEYTCAANGLWEGGSLECEPVTDYCPSFDIPNNHTGFPGLMRRPGAVCAQTIGSVCHAVCDVDHGWERASGDGLYKCTAEGDSEGIWLPEGGEELVCEKRCPAPADDLPVDGSLFPAGCDRTPGSGEACTARCDEGWEKIGGSPAYTCSADAMWVPTANDPLVCRLTGCAEATPLKGGGKCEGASVGEKCHPACTAGYESQGGLAEYTCQPDHSWKMTGDDVQCKAIPNYCHLGPIEGSANVQIKDDKHCDGTVGSRCTPSCAAGSERVEGATMPGYRCLASQQWQAGVVADPLRCEKTCDGVEPADPRVKIEAGCPRSPRKLCKAQCEDGSESPGGGSEYICGQSADGSKGEWQEGSLECVVKCDAGFEPINMTEMNSTVPCAGCDIGRFSYYGVECLECLDRNEDRSLCYKCPAGQGPNPKTQEREANTICEICSDRQLVSVDGVCKPSGWNNIPKQMQDLWDESTLVEKGLEIAGLVLLIALLVCCCCRMAGQSKSKKYLADLLVAISALVLLFIAVEVSEHEWEAVCAATVAASWLPIPHIIRRYEDSLISLSDPVRKETAFPLPTFHI